MKTLCNSYTLYETVLMNIDLQKKGGQASYSVDLRGHTPPFMIQLLRHNHIAIDIKTMCGSGDPGFILDIRRNIQSAQKG